MNNLIICKCIQIVTRLTVTQTESDSLIFATILSYVFAKLIF